MYTIDDILQIILVVSCDGRVDDLNFAAKKYLSFDSKYSADYRLDTIFRDKTGYVIDILNENNSTVCVGDKQIKMYGENNAEIEVTLVRLQNSSNDDKHHLLCIPVEDRKKSSCREKVTSLDKSYETLKNDIQSKIFTGFTRSFRNIMGTVIGYAEMASDSLADSDEAEPLIKEILAAGTRGKSLLNRITALTVQSESHLVSLDPENFFQSIIENSKDLFPKEISVSIVNVGAIKSILVDPVRLEHTFLSIILNGIVSFSNGKGRVEISIHKKNCENQLNNPSRVNQDKQDVVVSITDNGRGIRESEKICFNNHKEFQHISSDRIKNLIAVRKINEAQGVDISIVNGSKGATTIELCFSVSGESAAKTPSFIEPPRGSNELILVVDDEKSVADITSLLLVRHGYKVAKETSSTAAFEYFKQNIDKIDLLITDQIMPEMSGLELITKILAIRPDLPVVMLTGYSSGMTKEYCVAHGVKDLAMKPLDKRELAYIVHNALKS